MTEPRDSDRSQARREAATLLGVDIEHLSPADNLRVDMVSALRLVIDHEQAGVLDGGSADLGKLNVAVQSLIALLPGRELPKPAPPADDPNDPRKLMWATYLEMRRRGDLAGDENSFDFQRRRRFELEAEVGALKSEIEHLKAGTTAPGAPVGAVAPVVGDNVVPLARPPNERICERSQNSPSPPAAAAPPPVPAVSQSWDETENGRLWQQWHDAGATTTRGAIGIERSW